MTPRISYTTQKTALSLESHDISVTNPRTEMQSWRNEAMLNVAFKPVLEKKLVQLISWYKLSDNAILSPTALTDSFINTYGKAVGDRICADMDTYIKDLTTMRQVLFNCVVLGVGTDGHIAGIFTTKAHTLANQNKSADYFIAPQEPRHRMSLLPHVLNNTLRIIILVHKKGKEQVLETILNNQHTLFNQLQGKQTTICCYNNT